MNTMGKNFPHEKEIIGAEREEKKPLDVVGETLYINETKIEPMELDLFKKK